MSRLRTARRNRTGARYPTRSCEPLEHPPAAPELSGRAEAHLPKARGLPLSDDVAAAFDWHTFICTGCATETFVGREPQQSVEDFVQMCEWLYGSPPVCSHCLGRE